MLSSESTELQKKVICTSFLPLEQTESSLKKIINMSIVWAPQNCGAADC